MRATCVAIALLWSAAAGAEEVLYRLPWSEGLSFMFTQVSDGRITTHITKATLHAVDIAMPEGMAVLAARAGLSRRWKRIMEQAGTTGRSPTKATSCACAMPTAPRRPTRTSSTRASRSPGERVDGRQLLGYSGAAAMWSSRTCTSS
jgi:hypothetical protein